MTLYLTFLLTGFDFFITSCIIADMFNISANIKPYLT